MVRKRKIRHYANGWVIRLLQQDVEDLGFDDGDFADIDDLVVIKKKRNNNGN